MANKVGRPSLYTPELAKKICDELSVSSVGLRKLCLIHSDFPDHATIRRWVVTMPEFYDNYMRAVANRAMWLAEEVEDISDDGTNDTYVDDDGFVKTDSDVLQRSRLRIDTRKWIASKMLPKIYGDHKIVEDLEKQNEKLREEMLELRASLDAKNKKEF